MEFLSNPVIHGVLLTVSFSGGALSYFLGAGRVPRMLKPLADAWLRAGHNPKWITIAMWAAFAISFTIFVGLMGLFMFDAARDLGTPSF